MLCRHKTKVSRLFQLTAARRRLETYVCSGNGKGQFQLTAARRRLVFPVADLIWLACFNSQPPEGGWVSAVRPSESAIRFNSQPPEGGWAKGLGN